MLSDSVGPCSCCFALNLTQEVHYHLHTWQTHRRACIYTKKKTHAWTIARCDWLKADCNCPVIRRGFIGFSTTVNSQKTQGKANQTVFEIYCMVIPKCNIYTALFLNFLIWRFTEGNESLYGSNLGVSSEIWQPTPRGSVGQPVGGCLPSKSENFLYASLLHLLTQSRSFSEWLLHLLWLWVIMTC